MPIRVSVNCAYPNKVRHKSKVHLVALFKNYFVKDSESVKKNLDYTSFHTLAAILLCVRIEFALRALLCG